MLSSLPWYCSALIALVCYRAMALLLKKISFALPHHITLLYLFTLTSLLYLLYTGVKQTKLNLDMPVLWLLIAASGCAFLGNYFDLKALSEAPNAGYAAAIKGGQIIFITVGALYFFKDQALTLTGTLGIILIIVGIILLSTQ